MREAPWGRHVGRLSFFLLAFGLGLASVTPLSHARAQPKAYQVSRFDLSDPRVMVHLTFAGGQPHPNGPEAFSRMVARTPGAVVVNGTFFNVRTYETFGNLVTGGRLVQHRDWDDRGTALVIGRDRRGRLHGLRDPGWPDYQRSWLVLPAGPQLLRDGKIALNPQREGFQDPLIFSRKPRTALGLSDEGRTLWVVTIRQEVDLEEEAKLMQRLGVTDALNLDGGTSVGLATSGRVRLHPRTPLTQALVVYDARHPAPQALSERYATWLKTSGTPGTATRPPRAHSPR